MTLEFWIVYTFSCAALLAIPGPTIVLVVSYALEGGRKSAWWSTPGVVLGDFTAMTLSLLGAGLLLQTSATLFSALKMIGAIYLTWLGIKLWRKQLSQQVISPDSQVDHPFSIFLNCFVVTSLNPKGIVFFIAFLPQFLDPIKPVIPQFIIMEITFLVLAGLNVIIWATMVGSLRSRMQRPSVRKTINRIGGSFLAGAGLFTLASKSS